MLSYRVMLDVPIRLSSFLADLLADHRREIGTRRGTRALTCWKQAVFALAGSGTVPVSPGLGTASGSPRPPPTGTWTKPSGCWQPARQACARRWRRHQSRALADQILDGKVVAADRCKEKTISRKGREIDRWYSGKAHGFGGNIQALFTPGGIPLWVSAVLPGGVRHHRRPRARPRDLAAVPQGPAGTGRLRLRRRRLRHSRPGEEPSRQPGA